MSVDAQRDGKGVARIFFWGGINFTAQYYSLILTSSAAISAQNNFQWLILGGYVYRYTPVATPLVMGAQPNIGESSVMLFFVGRRKAWLTLAGGVPCSNAVNIGESKSWT